MQALLIGMGTVLVAYRAYQCLYDKDAMWARRVRFNERLGLPAKRTAAWEQTVTWAGVFLILLTLLGIYLTYAALMGRL